MVYYNDYASSSLLLPITNCHEDGTISTKKPNNSSSAFCQIARLASRRIVAILGLVLLIFTITIHSGVASVIVKDMSISGLSYADKSGLVEDLDSYQISDLELSDGQANTVDIVVSMYQEDQGVLAETLRQLKELEPLKVLDIRTIIYIKDEQADLEAIKQTASADIITVLPNKGREGGTYLYHINSRWGSFAGHTLFIQASIHNLEEVKSRISDYFVPQTGVLSLGDYGFCDCLKCTDAWNGDITWPRLPELWSAVNGELCPGSGIVMSYLGQMIVSRRRIMATDRRIYENLQDVLESESDHWIHSDPRPDFFHDVATEPFFGHTLERSWMTLFGCWHPRLHETCPSLGEKRLQTDTDETCQCLDS